MNEREQWGWITGLVAIVMAFGLLTQLIEAPAGPREPTWQAIVGQGASRHAITVYGAWDEALIQAALARDASTLSPDQAVRPLQRENAWLKAEVARLSVQCRYDEAQIRRRQERGQAIIEAVVRASAGTQDWDDEWLQHYGLVRTWRPRKAYWQNHRKDEIPLGECHADELDP